MKLSFLIFSATEQLPLTLQGKDTSLQQAVTASQLAVNFLQRQRSDEAFSSFYSKVVAESKDLTGEPVLPRQRCPPRRLDDGAEPHLFRDPQSLFRVYYFEAIDFVLEELKQRFAQTRGMPLAAMVEKLLLDSANGVYNFENGLPGEISLYEKDIELLYSYKCFQT